ncbi:MAG: SusC/RagA family TonB-linked outer membrane protein [Balneolaceae bacterium]|nr:SusC/RagA family TonB-linked outer membrane protein [Balneolaceae bacterium]
MLKKLHLLFIAMFLSVGAYAQSGTLTGTITDAESGEALPAVNVVLTEITKGTATDLDGHYEISGIQPGTYTVKVTYIGFQTLTEEIQISSGENVKDFSLAEDIGLLDEIVVSGVADATPRKLLTVSVAKVDAERLNQVPATSVSSSLAAKVSGVTIRNTSGTPGGESNIQLRADNNLGISSEPLMIVDGVIIEGSLSDINVDDIQSIEVVKGAAASSLYGSRAGNGVVVVTTKRGSTLENGAIDITVRNEVGIQQLENTIDLAEHHYFDLADDWESAKGTYTKFAGVDYPAGYVGGYDNRVDGSRSISEDRYMDNPFGVNNDIQDQFFQNGTNYTNFVSIATRVDQINVYASFENNSQEGIIPDTDGFQRQNFRINADYQINDWLRVATSNLFIDTSSEFPGSGGGIFFDLVLAEPDNNLYLENPDGQPYYIRHNQWSNEENPLYNTWKEERVESTKRQISNFNVLARPVDWIEYKGAYSFENESYNYTSYTPFDTWGLGSSGPGPENDLGINYTQGDLYKYFENTYSEVFEHSVTFRKSFGNVNWKSTFKYQWERLDFEYFDSFGQDFAIIDTPTLDAFPSDRISASSSVREIQSQNFYGTAYFNIDDTYIVDALLRQDESSLFGPDSRSNLYYRVSAGYILTESFDIPFVDYLKLRVAQGTSGNRPRFSWQYETFSLSNGVASKNTLGNENLKPSQTKETEFGLNTSIGNLSLEAIYSTAETTDQFLRVPLLPVAGYNGQYQNAGTIEANTFEFNADADLVQTDNFRWNLGVTWQTSKQEITALEVPPYASGPSGLYFIREGEDYGAIYGRAWVRSMDQMAAQLEDGDSIDNYEVNSDGYVIEKETAGTVDESGIYVLDENGDIANIKIGNGRPDWTSGISNTVSYKGFSAYLLLDIKHGGDVYNRKSQWLTRDARNGIMDMAGVPDDQKKTVDYYQSFYDVNSNNAYWVEDAGYVKVRELAFSYNFGAQELQPLFGNAVKNIKVSAIGRNLLTFSDYSGYDPEVGSIRNPFDGTGTYPNFRNFAFSVQVKF